MNLITRFFTLLSLPRAAATPVADSFTALFNGCDFTGWKLPGQRKPSPFRTAPSSPKARRATLHDGSFRNHSFRNFEPGTQTRAGSNGGVYVLTEYQATGGNASASGRFPSKGFEIQVNNSHTDRIRTGSLYHVSDVLDQSPAKDDEWFTEHIIVQGDTITVNVNDKRLVQWTQPADWDGGREGPGRKITGPGTIALQGHDPNSTVYYKNIRIKPLD
jgi:hypothetical protein